MSSFSGVPEGGVCRTIESQKVLKAPWSRHVEKEDLKKVALSILKAHSVHLSYGDSPRAFVPSAGAFVLGIVLWNVEISEMSSVLVDVVELEVRYQCTVIVLVRAP